jgi:hypothetical protein
MENGAKKQTAQTATQKTVCSFTCEFSVSIPTAITHPRFGDKP